MKHSHHPKFDKLRRFDTAAADDKKIMDGKPVQQFFLTGVIYLACALICLSIGSHALKDHPVLRGGLVFTEEDQSKPLYINRETFPLKRTADTSRLAESAQRTADLLQRYNVHCKYIADGIHAPIHDKHINTTKRKEETLRESPLKESNKKDSSYEFVASPGIQPLYSAPAFCKRIGGRLPELRTVEKQERIRKFAIDLGVRYIYSGIYLDMNGKVFRYKSDDSLVLDATTMNVMYYGGQYGEHSNHKGGFTNWYLIRDAQHYPLLYKNPKEDFHIRVASAEEAERSQKIICERDVNNNAVAVRNQTNMLVLLAHHNCQRDGPSLKDEVYNQIKDIEAITNLQLKVTYNRKQHEEIFFPRGFQKRDTTYQDLNDPDAKISGPHADDNLANQTALKAQANERLQAELFKAGAKALKRHKRSFDKLSFDSQRIKDRVQAFIQGEERPGQVQQLMTELHTFWSYAKIDSHETFEQWLTNQTDIILIEEIEQKIFFNPDFEAADIDNFKVIDNYVNKCLVLEYIVYLNLAAKDNIRYLIMYTHYDKHMPFNRFTFHTPLRTAFRKIAQIRKSDKLEQILQDLHQNNFEDDCLFDDKSDPEEDDSKKTESDKLTQNDDKKIESDKLTQDNEEKKIESDKLTLNEDKKIESDKLTQEEDESSIQTTTMSPEGAESNISRTLPDDTTTEPDDFSTLEPESTTDDLRKQVNETKAHRAKRALPLAPLIAVAGGANVIYSLVEGGAPLSWVGQIAGAIFGTATEGDIKRLDNKIGQVEGTVDVLRINSAEIQKAIYEVDRRLIEISDMVLSSHSGTAVNIMEQDLKSMIRHQVALQEAAILKYSSIFIAALNGNTSPYAMSQQELEQTIAKVRRDKNIQLEADIKHVTSVVVVRNHTIHIYMEVPIIDEGKMFTLFRVQTLPIYHQNKTFYPELDQQYIGMSKAYSEYIVLSESEFTKCALRADDCTVSSPVIPITKNSHCVIATYTSQKMQCTLVERDVQPRAEFISKGNTTIYSVPSPTRLYIKCDNLYNKNKYVDSNTILEGMGDIAFRGGCTITTLDGTKWTTPNIHLGDTMPDNDRLFNKLKSYPVPKDITIRFISTQDLSPLSERNYTEFKPTSGPATFKELATASFDFIDYMKFLMRSASIIFVLIIILILVYKSYRACRKFFGPMDCCPCIDPYPDTKGQIDNLDTKYKELEDKMKRSFRNFRDSTRSLAQSYATSRAPSQASHRSKSQFGSIFGGSYMSMVPPDQRYMQWPMPPEYSKSMTDLPTASSGDKDNTDTQSRVSVRFDSNPDLTTYTYRPRSILKTKSNPSLAASSNA